MKQYNRVCARINLDAIAYNMEQMKNRIGQEGRLIAVIKTDAYGHGAVPLAEMFEETPYIWGYAVACMGEARTLRAHGIKKPILILGCVFPDEYEEMVEKEIRAAVYTEEMAKGMAEAAVRSGKTAFLHIKIDTGFGRYGFVYNNRDKMLETLTKIKNIKIEGTFTHFSNAYYDDKYTQIQFQRFMDCIEVLKMNNIETGILHVCNTSAFIKFPQMHLNAVRIGSAFTGRISFKNSMGLRKIGYLKSNVAEIKELPKGFNIGYSNTYTTKKTIKVAIIPCGYMDGVNIDTGRDMFRKIDKLRYIVRDIKDAFKKQQIYVKINGQNCPILGRIGTYHVTVDITGKDIKINDEAIFTVSLKHVDSSLRREWN